MTGFDLHTRLARAGAWLRRLTGRIRPAVALVFAGLLLLASGCEAVYPQKTEPARFAAWSGSLPEYHFRPGDEVEVRFTFNPELNDRLLIGPDGRFSMPIVGQIDAAGQTAPSLSQAIARRFAPTLRNPQVVVTARSYASQQVFVGGEVQKPGIYVLPGPVGTLEAVQLAGGFTNGARKSEVILIRRNEQNLPMMRTVNETDYLNKMDVTQDVPLQGSDVIYVPRSTIAEVDLFVDQFIKQVLPFSTNFSYTAGAGGVLF